MTRLLIAFLFLLQINAANPELMTRHWRARWISAPGTSLHEYGVFHFRKQIDLAAPPASYLIHVTADNRYQLFVNGERVVWGPARGDLFHWRYESVDIAKHLKPGRNVLAAVVCNAGRDAAAAQITHETGFLLQGDTAAERAADTNKSWKSVRNAAYSPTNGKVRGYYAAGPGEQVDGASYPWGWERPEYDDSSWSAAWEREQGSPRDVSFNNYRYHLVPRNIPLMEEKPEQPMRFRSGGSSFPLRIGANQKVRVLLDQNYLTTGYPEMRVSRGKGASVRAGYAEALFQSEKGVAKGNRNDVDGKIFEGYYDLFTADGGERRMFRPLWWRTWRYIELTIETKDEPLVIEGLGATYTGYPFERQAQFDAGSAEISRILDVGWRTARLCSHETYMDCPYYEQLQYVGDTRIQALISIYMTGDARLVRNAIEQIDSSRTAEGATFSRAPSALQQYIPPFSLWWIGMVHDYWMYRDDPQFVQQMMPGVRAVLGFFHAHQKANGSLGAMPWWNFIDWTKEWNAGVPAPGPDGSSAPVDLQLLLAYQWAGEMERAMGSKALASEYEANALQLKETIRSLYWDQGRKLFADRSDKTKFSQHANSLAILADVVPAEEARSLIERTAADKTMVQASIYFRHYLHSALNKAGSGDAYLDQLDPWRQMLGFGLTTWAEQLDPTRSDCHAWGASPNYELFRTVLGIDSAAPGFQRVSIRPFLGKLTKVSGSIPHPKGTVSVSLELRGNALTAEVSLPPGVQGDFEWKGVKRQINEGKSMLRF